MRSKLYALSYKALSYAEIKKDLNKEIYKENKTEKGRDWKSSTKIYETPKTREFPASLFWRALSRKVRKPGGQAEADGRIRDRLRI